MPADNRQSADQLLTDRKQQLLAFVDKQNFTFSPCNPNPFVFQEKHELLLVGYLLLKESHQIKIRMYNFYNFFKDARLHLQPQYCFSK